MCFASVFLWCISVSPILKGRGEKYPNIESGQFQLKYKQLYILFGETSYEKKAFSSQQIFASAHSLGSHTTLYILPK